MGKERDTLRTGVEAVIVTERVGIGMAIAHVMETVVAMERDTATQKAAAVTLMGAVMLMAILMERTGMEEVEADMERAEVQMMVGMVKAGKKFVIVKARWTPRWTAPRWTRWTARQIRLLMASLSPSHPSARKVDGTVRGYVLKREINCLLILFLERLLVTRCLRAGLGHKV